MPKALKADLGDVSFCAHYFPASAPKRHITLFCLPGGGASRDYFDLAPAYSFAQRMSAAGFDVITMDHPGTASNLLPDGHPFLTPRQSAAYIDRCISKFEEHGGIKNARRLGIGHSMGGMIAVLTQVQSRAFDALILLGSSAGGLEWGLDDHEKTYIDKPDAFARDLEILTLRKFKMEFPPGMGGPSGKSITFGGENPEVTAALREVSCNLFAAGGMMSMTRGSFGREVQMIDVPLFFAFGDHDIGIAPEEAPKAFINAPSSALCILETTGHNSFAFESISQLCEELNNWISGLFIFSTP